MTDALPNHAYQIAVRWQPDLLSLIFGLAVGLAVAGVAWALRPFGLHALHLARRRLEALRSRRDADTALHYLQETAAYAARYHLLGDRVPLDALFMQPLLRPPLVDPEDVHAEATVQVLSRHWLALGDVLAPDPRQVITVDQALRSGRRLAVSAAPGAGKSTLLAHLAWRAAQPPVTAAAKTARPRLADPLIGRFPIFLHCGELPLLEDALLRDPRQGLTNALCARASRTVARELPALLAAQLAEPRALLLLDGWDELPFREQERATAWLRRILALYEGLQVVVAAPDRGYGLLLEAGFVVVDLLPPGVGQGAGLAEKLRSGLAATRQPFSSVYWRAGQPTLDMLLRLQLALAGDDVPQSRARLFAAQLARLLAARAGTPAWLPAAARRAWSMAAHAQLAQPAGRLAPVVLQRIAQRVTAELKLTDRGAVDLVVDSFTRGQLFHIWPDGAAAVRCPAWRNFLAALFCVVEEDRAAEMLDFDDLAWSETRAFYVGLTDRAGALALELLYADDRRRRERGLFEVATWLPEVAAAGEWRRQVLKQLGQITLNPRRPLLLRERAVAALAQTGDEGVLALLRQLLQRSEVSIRQVSAAALVNFGAAAVEPLTALLENEEDAGVRLAAVDALVSLADPAAAAVQVRLLLSEDEQLAHAVARHLALRGGDGWQLLQEALLEPAAHVRRSATIGLGLLDNDWAYTLLDNLRRSDEAWMVRAAGAAALDEMEKRTQATGLGAAGGGGPAVADLLGGPAAAGGAGRYGRAAGAPGAAAG